MSEELSQGPGTWQVFDSPLSYCDACVHSYMHQGFELDALGHHWLYALLGLVFWPAHSTYIRAFSLWIRLSLGSQASMFIIDPEPEIEHVLWKLESHWISWTSLWFWRLQLLIVCGLLVCRSIGVFAEIEAFEWPNCLDQIIHMPDQTMVATGEFGAQICLGKCHECNKPSSIFATVSTGLSLWHHSFLIQGFSTQHTPIHAEVLHSALQKGPLK